MCGYFCIGFNNFILKRKSFPKNFRDNDKIILNYFFKGKLNRESLKHVLNNSFMQL